MLKRTKIIATLGPATDDPKIIDQILNAGVDVVRLNFSHGDHASQIKRANLIRDRAQKAGKHVGVMVDLQGPKIRVGQFKVGQANLIDGTDFCIDAAYPIEDGNDQIVGCTYQNLSRDLNQGDTLMIDDGRIVLWVQRIEQTAIHCQVKVGGMLYDNKGINVQGGGLSAPSLTDKDHNDIKIAAQIEADYLAVSFVQSQNDVYQARQLISDAGWPHCAIVAKIERAEAIIPEIITVIIEAADVIMVARGDLGVEIGDARLPPTQKQLIKKARSMNCVVITATQMMESMIENSIPTRAEVFDVANAVLDGTDAVMLSAETATGKHPVLVIESMANICRETEKQRTVTQSDHRINSQFEQVDESIAMATMYIANHLKVKAIACLTESGSTTLWMSRIRSGIPIFAMAHNMYTRRKVTMYRGVYPVHFDIKSSDSRQINEAIIDDLLSRDVIKLGDFVIITKGDYRGIEGGTNGMKIIKAGNHKLIDADKNLFI